MYQHRKRSTTSTLNAFRGYVVFHQERNELQEKERDGMRAKPYTTKIKNNN